MERHDVTSQHAAPARQAGRPQDHVVGDTIVDSYTIGAMMGATKTPDRSVQFERKTDFIGGRRCGQALRSAGPSNVTDGAPANDAFIGFRPLTILTKPNQGAGLIDKRRPTVTRTRLWPAANRYSRSILSITARFPTYFCGNEPIRSEHKGRLPSSTDFRHGIFNRRTIPGFIQADS